MDRSPDRRLIRYLHGELPAGEVRRLRAELARDPAMQARMAELHRLWQGLQVPPPTPAPFGFVPRLQRVATERRAVAGASLLGWRATPAWARALAGAAMAAGIALGIGLGHLPGALRSPSRTAGAASLAASTAAAPSPAIAVATAAPAPAPSVVAAAPSAPPIATLGEPAAVAEVGSSTGGGSLADEYWDALTGEGESDTL